MNPTVPLPNPLAPDVTVSHVAALTADHPQSAADVTATVPVELAAGTSFCAGESETGHPPGWATVKRTLLMMMLPWRAALFEFASTRN